MEKNKTQLVIWDWNGTLQDDSKAAWEAVNDMLERRSMPPITFEQYSSYIETPIIGFYRHIFDLEKIPFSVIIKEFAEGFDLHMKGRGLMKGAAEALERIGRAGIAQIIVSSSEKGILMRYAEGYGVLGHFDAVLASDDFEAGSKVERAAAYIKASGIPAENTVVVGDMLHDGEVARAIGARCILVAQGHQTKEDLQRSGMPVAADITLATDMILNNQ